MENNNIVITKFDDHAYKLYAMQQWNTIPSIVTLQHEVDTDKLFKYLKDESFNLWFHTTNIESTAYKTENYTFGNPKEFHITIKFSRIFIEGTLDSCTDFVILYNEKAIDEKTIKSITEFIINNEIEVIDFNRFFMVTTGPYGYELQPTVIDDVEMDLDLNYGKGFKSKYDKLVDSLINDSKGIYLLHGLSGTGKTMIIRHLISIVSKEKDIIYLPSYMMNSITNPEFISFLKENKGSILILEDAESVLQKRDGGYNDQVVSNILNITDGLLNDVTGMQIITTFNANKNDIDPAILRAGRLIFDHEFKELSAEDATELSKNIGKNIVYTMPVILTEVYNGESTKTNINKKKKVGFNK